MTIAADQNVGVGPVVPQIRQQPDQDHRIFGPRRAGARTQVGRDQGMRRPFENEERQIAMVLIVMIIEGKLLLPIRGIIGVVDIEDNGWGRLSVTRNKVVDQGSRETIEVFAISLMFQTGEGGCTGSVLLVV